LREAESVAMLFPSVRIQGRRIEAFAEKAAVACPDDDPPSAVLADGLGS
jgi:hypothetical protein